MSCRRVAIAAGIIAAGTIFFAACSSDDDKKNPPSDPLSQGGSAGTGGSAAGGTAGNAGLGGGGQGGDAAVDPDAPEGSLGGAPGDGGPDAEPVCGDGVKNTIDEECDGADLGGKTCADVGFDTGTLVCTECKLETTGCTGVEKCWDGKDNDGDKTIDCSDTDCTEACKSTCTDPPEIVEPAFLTGLTTGHASELSPSCLDTAKNQSGAEIAFKVIPAVTGGLSLELHSDANFGLSVRTACDQVASEFGCTDFNLGASAYERLKVPCQQGVPIYVVVDGTGATEAGSFTLDISSKTIECGNASLDLGEECDDGNLLPLDGCDATCKFEVTETEPNNAAAEADAFVVPYVGRINPAGDVDVVKFTITDPGVWSMEADVYDMGDGACSKMQNDSYLELIASDGTTVLKEDDDSGDGYCSSLAIGQLAPGDYYLRVSARPAAPPTWSYYLHVLKDKCGNNVKSDGEQCDDGNLVAGDGCSPNCTSE